MISQLLKYTSLTMITFFSIVSFMLITTQWQGTVQFLFGS